MRPRRLGRLAGRSRMTLRRELVAFVSVALLVLFLVAGATYFFAEKIARDSARREAETSVSRLARVLVEPLIGNVLNGEPEDERDLDQIIDIRMSDGTLTKVVVWTAEGRVVYSSDKSLEDRLFPLTPELTAALNGQATSDIDDAPEVDEDGEITEPQLEVYVPLDVEGLDLAFEAYFSTSMIDDDATLLRSRTVPLAIGALIVLQMLQFPIAASM